MTKEEIRIEEIVVKYLLERLFFIKINHDNFCFQDIVSG
jgi:hypothetical protein